MDALQHATQFSCMLHRHSAACHVFPSSPNAVETWHIAPDPVPHGCAATCHLPPPQHSEQLPLHCNGMDAAKVPVGQAALPCPQGQEQAVEALGNRGSLGLWGQSKGLAVPGPGGRGPHANPSGTCSPLATSWTALIYTNSAFHVNVPFDAQHLCVYGE